MSKSNARLQTAAAVLIAAIVLAGCEYVEPLAPHARAVVPAVIQSSIDTPDHP